MESFVQFAQKIVEETRKESGCIAMGYTKIRLGRKLNLYFMKNIKIRLHCGLPQQVGTLKTVLFKYYATSYGETNS